MKHGNMKTKHSMLAVLSLMLLAGCVSGVKTSDLAVRAGMSRDDLKLYFGEPLRVETAASGAEDWYYRFESWKTHPTSEGGTSEEPGGASTSYVSVSLEISHDSEEHPIHVSPQGYVVGPIPDGKIVKPRR
jgi:outer membrane protein assembly factor BamE (lipoprotein component of BamABCDE complex)